MTTYRKLAVKPETYDKIEACVDEFLAHNPTFEGMKVSKDFIVNRIAKFYLGEKLK